MAEYEISNMATCWCNGHHPLGGILYLSYSCLLSSTHPREVEVAKRPRHGKPGQGVIAQNPLVALTPAKGPRLRFRWERGGV